MRKRIAKLFTKWADKLDPAGQVLLLTGHIHVTQDAKRNELAAKSAIAARFRTWLDFTDVKQLGKDQYFVVIRKVEK